MLIHGVHDANSPPLFQQDAASDAAGGYRRNVTQFEQQASETAASAAAAAADTWAGRQVLPSITAAYDAVSSMLSTSYGHMPPDCDRQRPRSI